MVAHTALILQLRSLTDRQIRDSLEVPREQPDALLASILRWAATPPTWQKLQEHPAYGLLVRCCLPRHALVIMCVREAGCWKIAGLPSLSMKVLRYRTVDEASAHNDAMAE